MHIYLQFSFWTGLICLVIRLVMMGCVDWPLKREPKSLGAHLAETIIGLATVIWISILLFK